MLALAGCKRNVADNDDNNGPNYQPAAIIRNSENSSFVYDSTVITVLVFARGKRSVFLSIDNKFITSIAADTLTYKWDVQEYPKFSKHILNVKVTSGEDDALASNSNMAVYVSHSMIAFASNYNGDYQIYFMNDDGSQLTQISKPPGEAFHPIWSPAGDKIAYVSKNNTKYSVHIYDLKDSSVTEFMEADSNHIIEDLSWSNITNKIAYSIDGKIATKTLDKTVTTEIPMRFFCRYPSFGKNDELYFNYYNSDSAFLAIYDTAGILDGIGVGVLAGRLIYPVLRTNTNYLYLIDKNNYNLLYGALSFGTFAWQLNNMNTCYNEMDSTSFSFSPNGKRIAIVGSINKDIKVISYDGSTSETIFQGGANQSPSWSKR
jgi:hypothetical protein